MRSFSIAIVLVVLGSSAFAQEKKPLAKGGKPPENVRLALNTGGHSSPIRDLAFTPDGKKLVTLEAREVHVWDMATGDREHTWRLPNYELDKLALAPDGRTVAVASALMWGPERPGRWIEIWLLGLGTGATHKFVAEIGYNITSLQFSPDSKRLAYSTWYQAGVISQISKNGRITHVIKRDSLTGVARFNSDGTKLLVGGGKGWGTPQCQVYDVSRNVNVGKTAEIDTPLFELEQSSRKTDRHHLWEAEWAPGDGRFVAWDDAPGTALYLWTGDGKRDENIKGKPMTIRLPAIHYVNLLRFAGADKVLAVGLPDHETIRPCLVDLNTRSVTHLEFAMQKQEDLRLAATLDGGLLAVNSGPGFQVFVFDLKANKVLHRLGKPQLAPEAIAWGPDSRSIAWSSKYSKKVEKWVWEAGLNLTTLDPLRRDQVQEFRMVRSVRQMNWSAKTEGEKERSDKKIGVTLVHFGKRIETEVQAPLGGAIFYEEDGQMRVLVREHWNENLHILDAHTGKILHRYVTWGHHFSVSPDNKYLAVVKGEQTIEIYRIQGTPARLLNVLVFGHEWIAWTPQGYYTSSLGGERLMGWTIRKDFDTPLEFHPMEQFRKQLHRPDIVGRVLDLGGVGAAIKAANAVRNVETSKVQIEAPPTIALEVVDKSKLPMVDVRVTAAANGRPLLFADVFVDGIPAEGGHLDFKNGVNAINQVVSIKLPSEKPSAYNLSGMVSTADTYGFSTEAVEVAYINPNKLPVMHVLAIGINEYQSAALKLNCPAPDAQAILDGFQKCGNGGLFKKVVGKPLLDKQATSKIILDELEQMQKTVDENDLVVVFFAGHGVKDANDFYLLTEESQSKDLAGTALSGTTLRQRLGGFRCQVLLLLDACYSGAFGEAAKNLRPATDDAVRSLGDVAVRVAVLTAARGYEKAQAVNGRGLFTAAIVRALNKDKNVPFNVHDNSLYIDQLASYTLYEVQKASGGEQHPYLEMPRIVLPFPIVRFAKAG